jgi:hypothetical protein
MKRKQKRIRMNYTDYLKLRKMYPAINRQETIRSWIGRVVKIIEDEKGEKNNDTNINN